MIYFKMSEMKIENNSALVDRLDQYCEVILTVLSR